MYQKEVLCLWPQCLPGAKMPRQSELPLWGDGLPGKMHPSKNMPGRKQSLPRSILPYCGMHQRRPAPVERKSVWTAPAPKNLIDVITEQGFAESHSVGAARLPHPVGHSHIAEPKKPAGMVPRSAASQAAPPGSRHKPAPPQPPVAHPPTVPANSPAGTGTWCVTLKPARILTNRALPPPPPVKGSKTKIFYCVSASLWF